MDCYGWNFRFEVTAPPVLARLFSQHGAASINLAERFLKFVQRVIEPAPPIIHGLHLLAKLDPFLHLNVVLLDAIFDLDSVDRRFQTQAALSVSRSWPILD